MINDITLRFQKTHTVKSPWCRRMRLTEATLFSRADLRKNGMGIDPGVNFGLTYIDGENVQIFHGTLIKRGDPGEYGLVAYKFLQENFGYGKGRCIIEGSAFNKQYGQSLLSEVRTGFYLASVLWANFSKVTIIPPATIRKQVFDSGKTQAVDVWPQLEHNAADSLSMALLSVLDGVTST